MGSEARLSRSLYDLNECTNQRGDIMAIYKLITTAKLKAQFKVLVQQLFKHYDVEISTSKQTENEVDLIVTSDKEIHAIVELKLYRSRKVSLTTLENAISHTKKVGLKAGVSHLVLIVTSNVTDEWVTLAKDKHGIILWDQNDLLSLAGTSGQDHEGLKQFLETVNPTPERRPGQQAFIYRRHPHLDDIWQLHPKNFKAKKSRGEELYHTLTYNPRGSRKWTKFESTVFEIMKYLYDKDLSGWYKNLKAESGYNRFEMVCRINSKHDYWNRVAGEFNTRYIFFECKEYSEIFTYKNVISQEINYLAQAFRAIGFIVSREDRENYPDMYSQGAFYDNGKLLIHLTEQDLYRMLVDKDIGNDPTGLLRERLDEAMINITL